METSGSRSASISRKNARRTVNACLRCQRRKIGCDGEVPSCASCVKQEAPCHYTQRKRRGPGKSKRYIQMLEERLNRATLSSSRRSPLPQPHHDEAGNEASLAKSSDPPPMATGESQNTPLHNIEATGAPPAAVEVNFHTEREGNPGESLSPRIQPSAFLSRFPDQTTVKMIGAQQDRRCLPRTIFALLPPETFLVPFFTATMEDINKIYPLFTTESVLSLLRQQHAAGPDNCHDSPSRWATLNALLAMAIQWKAANNAFEELLPMSWTYFKNAFSVFPELITQGTGIETCQALLAMAMFMHGTADARTTSHLIAATARSLQIFGLCRREPHLTMNVAMAEQHKQLFWITHVLSSDATLKYGLPPVFIDDDVDVELPSEDPPDSLGIFTLPGEERPFKFFTCMAELSIIQSRIYRRLYSNMVISQDRTELLGAVAELDRKLETWKSGLPEPIRPSYNGMRIGKTLDIRVIQLHLSYYATVGKIHMALTGLEDHGESDATRSGDVNVERERSNMLQSSLTRAAAARATLVLLHNMPPQPLVYIWQILCHPVCATLTLTAAVLEDPSKLQAQLDVSLIGEFIGFLERLKLQEGCDVQRILDGCSRIHKIASNAVGTERDVLRPQGPESHESSRREVWDQRERLRLELSHFVDHMQLAQGLMSNLSTLCAKSANLFEILQMHSASKDDYGTFVSDALKPQTFNFVFGPRQ